MQAGVLQNQPEEHKLMAKNPEKPNWNQINLWNDDSDISKAMADTVAAVLGAAR